MLKNHFLNTLAVACAAVVVGGLSYQVFNQPAQDNLLVTNVQSVQLPPALSGIEVINPPTTYGEQLLGVAALTSGTAPTSFCQNTCSAYKYSEGQCASGWQCINGCVVKNNCLASRPTSYPTTTGNIGICKGLGQRCLNSNDCCTGTCSKSSTGPESICKDVKFDCTLSGLNSAGKLATPSSQIPSGCEVTQRVVVINARTVDLQKYVASLTQADIERIEQRDGAILRGETIVQNAQTTCDYTAKWSLRCCNKDDGKKSSCSQDKCSYCSNNKCLSTASLCAKAR